MSDVFASQVSSTILKGITWSIKQGEHWMITGDNGSGKTSLCKCLCMKLRISSGKLDFPFSEQQKTQFPGESIRMVSFTDTSKLFRSVNNLHYYQQRFNAFDSDGHLTTLQYLQTGGFSYKNKEHVQLIHTLGISDLLDMERIKLSSGQTRKMLLCKALLDKPKILILDNPYIGLDSESRTVFNRLLDQLIRQNDMSVILSGQFTSIPDCITHHIHLKDGRIALKQKRQKILSKNPYKFKHTQNIDKEYFTHKKNILYVIKRHFEHGANDSIVEEVLELKNVSVKYGDRLILNNLNWKVNKGEKWVLKGRNGSGKSTIVSLLYADNPQAYAHQVSLFGKRRGRSGESIWDVKKQIGFTSPELHAYFFKKISALDLVLTGLSVRFEKIKTPTQDKTELAHLLLEYFEIKHFSNRLYHTLSTGVQRLLFFIRSMIKCPQLLLLDEPFQGLDQRSVNLSKLLLSTILGDQHTLIFISHFEDEVPTVVEKVLDLDQTHEQ